MQLKSVALLQLVSIFVRRGFTIKIGQTARETPSVSDGNVKKAKTLLNSAIIQGSFKTHCTANSYYDFISFSLIIQMLSWERQKPLLCPIMSLSLQLKLFLFVRFIFSSRAQRNLARETQSVVTKMES